MKIRMKVRRLRYKIRHLRFWGKVHLFSIRQYQRVALFFGWIKNTQPRTDEEYLSNMARLSIIDHKGSGIGPAPYAPSRMPPGENGQDPVVIQARLAALAKAGHFRAPGTRLASWQERIETGQVEVIEEIPEIQLSPLFSLIEDVAGSIAQTTMASEVQTSNNDYNCGTDSSTYSDSGSDNSCSTDSGSSQDY